MERRRRFVLDSKLLIILLLIFIGCENDDDLGNRSIILDGNDCIRIKYNESLATLNRNQFTLEGWVEGDSIRGGDTPALWMIGDAAGGNELGMYFDHTEPNEIIIVVDNQIVIDVVPEKYDYYYQYVFFALTVDFPEIKLYINGAEEISAIMPDSIKFNGNDFLIGADTDSVNAKFGNWWYGSIDEVRLWKEALDAETIEFHHKNPEKLSEHYTPTGLDSLIGLWRFNTKDDDIVLDASGSENNGEIITDNGVDWRSQ